MKLMTILTQDMKDKARLDDLQANDEAERALQQADLDYLARQEQREAARLQETKEMELGYFDRMGWNF
jgi:hypothetical protein